MKQSFFEEISPLIDKQYEYQVAIAENNNAAAKFSEFSSLADDFVAKDKYDVGGTTNDKITKGAIWKTVKLLILYFVLIGIVGDFICKQFILKFITFIYNKIKNKIKEKQSQKDQKEKVFGSDYYSSLTINWVLPEGFEEKIYIEIQNPKYTYQMTIEKQDDYKCVNRIHAGIYKVSKFECEGYELVEMKEKLEVNGYQRVVNLTVKKIN